MYCPKHGEKNSTDAFCDECGKKLLLQSPELEDVGCVLLGLFWLVIIGGAIFLAYAIIYWILTGRHILG